MSKFVKEITSCKDCPFFKTEEKMMVCGHPYWDQFDDPWKRLHISQDDYYINNKAPDECPLRNEDLTIDYKFKTTEK